ncbi:hypothetical protein [Actinomadura algeriensis]|uniref:Uncharacterized protein n=1 Tax=Actinomadura algeriensis TaxID=1679523 RepID=A0ABR9K1I2_9ACTN|nr:hypothetical protein [Actinomadura algeriensis]MBE1536709.1 hypothetical protein [Actinomadura algeriensis]
MAGDPECEPIRMIGATVRGFVDSVDDPAHDGLEAALRLGGQTACRWLIRRATGGPVPAQFSRSDWVTRAT